MKAREARRRRLRAGLRATSLALVLGVTALVVPDAQQAPTEAVLVAVDRSQAVDLTPDVIWIAAIGSDARPWEDMTATRGDALQLVGLNTKTGSAVAFGIPRDSWVQVPGAGQRRINDAMTVGGPQLQASVMGDLLGIEPDYVVVTRFEGFEQMLGAVGRITVDNPYAFSDPHLRPEGYAAGKIELGRYGAMNYARIRKGLRDGDFGRSANQQRVMRGIHAAIVEKRRRPGFIERGAFAVLKHTSTDVPATEIFRIAQAVAQVDAAKITTCVVPGTAGFAGPASVVFPDTATARRWGAAAGQDASLANC
ncbi:LCP family protein [Nocardioides yefusunii]|uniref:LCP family protein n=1 Tax=Nocardioides yefusunii TaxID=2500546 RepID=A0ABW1QZ60_9ACTN|nr:LCP family protein [Nocardioides yefusunii]